MKAPKPSQSFRQTNVDSVYGVDVPADALYEAIEKERAVLSRVISLLQCLSISLEYDSGQSPSAAYYPDMADIASQMVRSALNGLDCVCLAGVATKTVSARRRRR